jgi:hypothetical protein
VRTVALLGLIAAYVGVALFIAINPLGWKWLEGSDADSGVEDLT